MRAAVVTIGGIAPTTGIPDGPTTGGAGDQPQQDGDEDMARIDADMVEQLNEQIGREFQAAQQYLAMAIYLDGLSLESMARFFYLQAEEERAHGMKIVHYLNEVGQRAHVGALEAPKARFESPLEVAETALSQERAVTDAIHGLVDAANERRDHTTFQFLQWFVDEQVEEEATFDKLVDVIKAARDPIQVENYVRHMLTAAG